MTCIEGLDLGEPANPAEPDIKLHPTPLPAALSVPSVAFLASLFYVIVFFDKPIILG